MRALWVRQKRCSGPCRTMRSTSSHAARRHNDIARDMLGVTAVIVLPFTTTTLVAAVSPIASAVVPDTLMPVIVTPVLLPVIPLPG
jgi:hypothetical protein